MFRKCLSLFAVMLLLASYCVNATTTTMDCGMMTPETCKMEFGTQMDTTTMMKTMEIMKMTTTKTMKVWTDITKELPIDSKETRTIRQLMNKIKLEMTTIDKMGMLRMMKILKKDLTKLTDLWTTTRTTTTTTTTKTDTTRKMTEMKDKIKMDIDATDRMTDLIEMEMLKNTMETTYRTLTPFTTTGTTDTTDITDTTVTTDRTTMETIRELMRTHGVTTKTVEEDLTMTMMELGKTWLDTMTGLRDVDTRKYPEYTKISETIKTMMETTDTTRKTTMFLDTMRMMTDLTDMPFTKTLMMMTMTLRTDA